MKTDTGGQAFPRIDRLKDISHPAGADIFAAQYERGGLTILDYFAGQISQKPSSEEMALISREMVADGLLDGVATVEEAQKKAPKSYFDMLARYRYKMAQAMIAEKKRLEGL